MQDGTITSLHETLKHMAELHEIERQGVAALTEHLLSSGRTVARSTRKTFDLMVDGIPAEIKCKRMPWSKLDFIGLTDKQRHALDHAESFLLFVVCNLKNPAAPEIIEIRSQALRAATFKVESTHYIYGKELKRLAGAR